LHKRIKDTFLKKRKAKAIFVLAFLFFKNPAVQFLLTQGFLFILP